MIIFKSKALATVPMFDADAKNMLSLMGHSGDIPSAIRAADLPSYIQSLRDNIEKQIQQSRSKSEEKEDEDQVGIRSRAFPLLNLLESAEKNGEPVLWDYE